MEPRNRANGTRSSDVLTALGIAKRIVSTEMIERGVKRPEAERIVARQAGISPSSIENMRRGRIKDDEKLRSKIKRAFAVFLERQIAGLEHELALARAAQRECDFSSAEAAIAAARAALAERLT